MSEVERFLQLQEDIRQYQAILAKASDAVVDGDVSNYPILVMHKQEVDVGIPIVEEVAGMDNWRIHMSSLEEFVTKQLIEMDKVDEFIRIYKEPSTHFCLFVISELGAQFIFIPRETTP